MLNVPNYLKDYEKTWKKDPHKANMQWFKDAKWGLFMHYGLYSQLERGEWVLQKEKIPLSEYEKLADTFDPKNFDADFITDLALEAEMKYVNLTTCHHEGFCLWNSNIEKFNSYSTIKRDLVRELAEQCDKKGLGFFAYYTHVLNWRSPYALPNSSFEFCRPHYDFEEPKYLLKDGDDISPYWDYAHACMEELLDLEYPMVGIWLDIIAAYYQSPELVRIEDTYKLIREKRPDTLISFKQGATGNEDFASPEFHFNSQSKSFINRGLLDAAERADCAWNINKHKHNEICMTLQKSNWGYTADSIHYDAEDVYSRLGYALTNNCNMLANTGPLPDGSIHLDDVDTLRTVGQMIRDNGWPTADDAYDPNKKVEPKGGALVG